RQQLAVNDFWHGKGQQTSIRVMIQEAFHLKTVFLCEYGTGDIEQFTAFDQGLPKGIERFTLYLGKLRQVAFAPQPFDVGMTPHYPGRRTGDISQDTIEWPSIPPLPGVRGVALNDAIRLEAETSEILL